MLLSYKSGDLMVFSQLKRKNARSDDTSLAVPSAGQTTIGTQARFAIKLTPDLYPLPDFSDKTKIDVKYPLIEPYAYVHIHWDEGRHELLYELHEPELNQDELHVLTLLEEGIDELINLSFIAIKSSQVIIEYLEKNMRILLREFGVKITEKSFLKLMYYVYRDFVGMNEIEPLLKDYYLEDIGCNGVNSSLYIVHRKYGNLRTNIIFHDIKKLTGFVEKLAQKCGKYVSYASPLLDGSLPDGSVDYQERFIYRENGRVKLSSIGSFVDAYYNDSESNTPKHVHNIDVPAFDQNLKITWKSLNYVYRHKINEQLYELHLEAGRKVRLTGAHSIFILRKEGVVAERVSNLKKGDYAIVPCSLPENNFLTEFNLARELSYTPFSKKIVISGVPKNFFLDHRKEIFAYYKNRYKRPYQAFSEHKRKGILPLGLYSLIPEKILRTCILKTTSAVTIPPFLPITKELLRLLGYYIAEGWLSKFGPHHRLTLCFNKDEKDYHADVNHCSCTCFSVPFYIEPAQKNAVKLTINSLLVYSVFKYVLKVSCGAKQKEVPEIVYNVSKELQKEFITGWHNGDCGSTASKKLANDISYLGLFQEHLVPFYGRQRTSFFDNRFVRSYEFYSNFYRRNITGFHTMIPMELFNPLNQMHLRFRNKRIRRHRLKYILDDIRFKRFVNLEKVTNKKFLLEWRKRGFIYDYNRTHLLTKKGQDAVSELNFVKTLIDSDLAFLRLNNIKRVDSSSEYVYDVSVPSYENFVAGFGGVCCHNSRVNATYTQDITSKGPSFSIRKFTKEPWTPVKLMHMRTVSPEMLAYLWILTEYEANILVIGGTGTGKTTFLNALAFFIPPQAKIVSIEDTRELNLLHDNWLPSVTREGLGVSNLIGEKHGEVTLFDLLRESFRQRPDYVIVGEIRGKEAFVLFQGMSSLRGDEEIFILKNDQPSRIKIKELETLPINELKTISYDIENHTYEILPLHAFVRHPLRNKLYKITTRFGREITVTSDHSLFTLDSHNKIIDIRTDELTIGRTLIIPATIPCGYHNIEEINLLEYLPDLRVYAPHYVREASHRLGYYPSGMVVGSASITDYYSEFKRSKPSALKAEKFITLMKEAGMDFDIHNVDVRYDKKSKSFHGFLKITDELLTLLGYYLSEGSLYEGNIALYNKKECVLEDMRRCIYAVTGIQPAERITEGYGTCLELSFTHKVLAEFIKRYCKQKQEKRVPDFIFGLDKRRIGVFLSALYCGDGYLEQRYFAYYTTSKNLAHDVAQLLLVYGIVARIGKRNRTGRKTTDYELLFYSSYKKEEFLHYVKPLGKEIDLQLFKKTDFNLVGDLYCDTIKSIEILHLDTPEYVYDISVPKNQNFIAGFGGVLAHNSGHPSFGTMHAEDVETMIRRLETEPINLSASLVESLDAVCLMTQTKIGGNYTRRLRSIVEILKIQENIGHAVTNTPFVWDPATDRFYSKSDSKIFDRLVTRYGIPREKINQEFKRRTLLLMKLYALNISGFKHVQDIITAYYKTPELVLKRFGIP